MSLPPISVSPDGRFLQDAEGRPFFWLADIAWTMCTRLTREEADRYFEDRAAKGFSVIQTVAAGGPWYDFAAPNRYGDPPFHDSDPTRPNEAYFEHLDWIIACAETHGLRVALLPIFAAADVTRRPAIVEQNGRPYAEWLARRYAGRGILWVLGGDTMPVHTLPSDDGNGLASDIRPSVVHDFRPIFDGMAAGIQQVEGPGAFITYHPTAINSGGTAEPRTSLYFGDRDWMTINMLQTSHIREPQEFSARAGIGGTVVWNATESHLLVEAEYRSRPVRPVIDGEPRFEDLPIDLDEDGANGFWTGYDARNAAYHAVFAGAAGHCYGNHSIWQSYGAGDHEYELGQHCIHWEEAMSAPASTQMGFLRSLFLSRPYFTRIPDQSMLLGTNRPGDEHVGVTRDRDGSWAMAYLPRGGNVTIDLVKMTGASARGWWFDPRTGSAELIGEELPTTHARRFRSPRAGVSEDWVLVLDDASRGYPDPGTAAV